MAESYRVESELVVDIRREAGKDGKRKKVNVKVAAPGLSGYEGVMWSFELDEAERVCNIYGRYVSEPSRLFEPPHTINSLDEMIKLISVDSCYRMFDVAGHFSYKSRQERTEHFEKFSKELRKRLTEAINST